MKPKVLLVDDREENLVALEVTLRRDDCELIKARSGREALELVLVQEVALALIDIQMPEMDGFELAELMRGAERTRSIPIIFITAGLHDQGRVFKGYDAGAVDFLLKPLDAHVLRSKVDIFLELYRQKQQLAERVRELEAVLAAVPAAVFVTRDAGARRIEGNRYAQELLRAADGALDSAARVIKEGREVAASEQPLQIAATQGVEVRGYDFDLVLANGSSLHLLGNATPMRDSRGHVCGAVGAFIDVTELKRAEERLREADRRKDEFLALLSHELRNPLMPIRTSLYILSRAAPGSEQARHAMAVMDRQSNHLTRLVDDLLDVTRIVKGKVQLQREPIDLAEVVRRTVDDHRSAFTSAGVELLTSIAAEPLILDADGTRMAQIVGNLLGNAVKFTPRGGRVWLELARHGSDAVLRVRDNGAGISPDVLGQLFEPFAQADRTLDRSRGGLGLGLALVKSLVEMHGGSVAAASQGPGCGAEFVIILPLAQAAAHAGGRGEPSRATPERQRVLIVEDNRDAAEALRAAIEFMGHEVAMVHDGASALAVARSFKPDVVFCDIGLPGMDGYEVARQFKRDEELHGVQLVALTGYASPEARERALDAGFAVHMSKPPQLDPIERLLARLAG